MTYVKTFHIVIISFIFKPVICQKQIMTTLGTRGFYRLLRKFSVLAEGRHIFGHRPKPRAATETGNHARKVAGTQGKS